MDSDIKDFNMINHYQHQYQQFQIEAEIWTNINRDIKDIIIIINISINSSR